LTDIFGNELFIDDIVALNPPTYKGLKIGRIIGFTPKKVRVIFDRYDIYDISPDNILSFSEEELDVSLFDPSYLSKYIN
jgi:hypothetical protein